jgi:hypothetical protein
VNMETPSNLTAEQQALAHYMSGVSEEAYCAGWLSGLEFALWEAVLGQCDTFGGVPMHETRAHRLRELARSCGGWIVFDESRGRTWLPLAEWEARFAEWQARKGDSVPKAVPSAPPTEWDSTLADRVPLVVERVGFLKGELRLYLQPAAAAGPCYVLQLEEVAAFYDRLPRGTVVRMSHSLEHGSFGWWLPPGDPHHQVKVATVTPEPAGCFLALARRVVYRLAERDEALNWPG